MTDLGDRLCDVDQHYCEPRDCCIRHLAGPVQEIDLVGASRFVVLRDPDGVLIELVEL